MKPKQFIAALIAFNLIWLSCEKDLTPISREVPATPVITGKVVEKHRKSPVSGAVVILVRNQVSDTTDSQGVYRFENIETGSDTIIIRAAHFHPDSQAVQISYGLQERDFLLNLLAQYKPYDLIVENSPYIFTDTYTVDRGDTLSVEPGVTLAFYTAKQLIVKGTFLAVGTEDDSIKFTAEPDPNFIGYKYLWRGVYFDSCSSETRLEYCTFEKYAGFYIYPPDPDYDHAILCDNSSPAFRHCVFPPHSYSLETGATILECLNNSSPVIEYCIFESPNTFTICIGCAVPHDFINESQSNPEITNNDFYVGIDSWAVTGAGFLNGNYIAVETQSGMDSVNISLGNPVDEIGDGIFTTTNGSCVNVDGITNPRRSPNMP